MQAVLSAIRELQQFGQASVDGQKFPKRQLNSEGRAFLIRQRHGLVMETMLARGLRFSEVSRMRLDQVIISPPAIFVHRSKRGVSASAPVPSELVTRLVTWHRRYCFLYRRRSDLLFPSREGTPLGNRIFNDMLREFAGLFDSLKLSSHVFRDSAAVKVIEQDGVTIVDAARFLGHRQTRSTETYINKREKQEVQLNLLLEF
jgi:integrase